MQCEAKIDGFITRLETAAPVALVGGVRALRQLPVRAGLQGEALGLRLVDELPEGDAAASETVRKVCPMLRRCSKPMPPKIVRFLNANVA